MLLCLFVYDITNPNYAITKEHLWIVAFVFLLAFVPDFESIVKAVRSVKVGDVEVNLREFNVSAREAGLGGKDGDVSDAIKSLPADVQKRLLSEYGNTRGTILMIATEIESRLKELAKKYKIKNPGYFSALNTVKELNGMGKIDYNYMNMIVLFWKMQNDLAHNPSDMHQDEIASAVKSGIDLLKYVYLTVK
jgi:hypothetical protein